MNFFCTLNPVLQAFIATLFTWGVTSLGAALVFFFKKVNKNIKNAIASSTVETANIIDAKLIVSATITGKTARVISNLRSKCPILATCTDEKVARSLSLYFGVYPKITKLYDTTDEIVDDAIKNAKKFVKLKKDDYMIITGAMPKNSPTNFMKIEKI